MAARYRRTRCCLVVQPLTRAIRPSSVHLTKISEAPFRRVSSGQLDMGAFEYQIAPADYNDDQQLDCNDVDALVAAIVDGNHPPEFDLTGDELADQADLDVWLALAGLENLPTHKPYLFGDADLGGLVTTRDLNTVGVNWRQEVTGWCRGDFNADGRVDAKDLNLLAINWKKDVVDPNVAPGVPRVPQATLADRAVAIAAVASDRATLLGSTAKKLPGNISIDSGTGAVSSSHFAKRYIRRELSRTAATAVPSVPLPPPGNLTESLTGRRWPQS